MKKIVWLLIVLLGISCSEKPPTTRTKNGDSAISEKPNIIYILADDLGYGDLSCYGQTRFSTPNIDKLAREGMIFTQHYSGSTVCAPSRSTLMTGLHTGHTYIRGNKEVRPEGQTPLLDNIFTLPEALQKAGYITGAFGKWGLGFPGSEGDPNNQGFNEFFGYNCQRLGHHYYPHYLWHNEKQILLKENEGLNKGTYAPELIHQKTLAFIEENKDQPFFLFVPSIIPHAEIVAPEEVMQKYRGKYLPEVSYEGTDGGEQYRKGPYESQKESHAGFVAMVDILDRHVGEIMKKVEDLGLAEKTLIVFTSDNGPHREGGADPEFFDSNGPLKGFKRDLYEGGIRVPMIARWKGKVKEGSKSDHVSAMWDIFSTVSEITDAPGPDRTDGVSMLPVLIGNEEEQKKHDYLYWEFHEKGGRVAVRKGDWKAVRYNVLKDPNAPIELYDLSEDLGEDNDVASLYPNIVNEMAAIMQSARGPSPVFNFNQNTYLKSK
jgi:arylsulfatase A-like enzyme